MQIEDLDENGRNNSLPGAGGNQRSKIDCKDILLSGVDTTSTPFDFKTVAVLSDKFETAVD